jgi:hypothetical protein
MLKFLNTFFIKYANIYFGHKDKVYVIIKQLIINVFGMCANGYVEKLERIGQEVTSSSSLAKL